MIRTQPLPGARRPFAHFRGWVLAITAAIFLIYQPLDSIGHVAADAYEAGNHSLLVRVASAFDVLDDSLDHMPGRGHIGVAQPQIQVIASLPVSLNTDIPFARVSGCSWCLFDSHFARNHILSGFFRPPRV